MRLLKQSTAANIMVLLVSSTDHVVGVTGATLTITASKDGAAFASISPTVTERGNGWYNMALTTAHTDTLGDLALHISATGADPADILCSIVAGALDADVSSRLAPTTAGRTLDVTATGAAGIDWANVENPTTAVNLSATNIDVDQVVASVTAGVTVTTNNDKTGYALSAVAIDAIWDEALSGHTTAGTAGKALTDAGAVSDPWAITVPGAYGAGSAGYVLGTNLNATVGSRATQTSVDAVSGFVDTEVAAIKAKTDNLPASFPTNFPNLLINSSGHLSRVTLVDTTTANTDMINAATIAASVWVKVAEGSYTVLDLLKIISAVSAGKLSGEPGSPVFRNITDTKNRVTGTVDGSGNRTAVTYDVT